MNFIGDIHGHFSGYLYMIKGMDSSIQVGDLGIFTPDDANIIPANQNHKFIRGNHDNPSICRAHSNYMGDYGHVEDLDLFYLSGAYSIDWAERVEWMRNNLNFSWIPALLDLVDYVDAVELFEDNNPDPNILTWWPDEELSRIDLEKAINLYISVKPKYVVSHECPTTVASYNYRCQTKSALDIMLKIHAPAMWVFGHHHKRIEVKMSGTQFIGLADFHPNKKWKDVVLRTHL